MAIIPTTPVRFPMNTIDNEPYPLDKGLIGTTPIIHKNGETCCLEFWGYVMSNLDSASLGKVYVWAKIADKTAAYAEVVGELEMGRMKLMVEYPSLVPTRFEIAPEFRKLGIKSRLLQVICELGLDLHRIAGDSEIVVDGRVVSTMRRELRIVGQPAQFGRWYALGGRVRDDPAHQRIMEELKKPKKERNWYLHTPQRGHMSGVIEEEDLRKSLAQKTAIGFPQCWERLLAYKVSTLKKQNLP
ncbi:MAG: hypothetical protein JSS10_06455 [Verrucomicrobia bacterium]|nr:hypothetical protein [Verrucomicrobiota bacterium]